MEKITYERPEINITEFKAEDVICTSGTLGGGATKFSMYTPPVETEMDILP